MAEQPVKRGRGRPKGSKNKKTNTRIIIQDYKPANINKVVTGKKEEISEIIHNNTRLIKRTIPQTDEEVGERLAEFFDEMVERGEIPTVEKMALALGITRQYLWDWEQGRKGTVRAMMVKRAKEVLAAIDAELVSRNKIPQVTYIFRSKNFFGMKDQQDHVVQQTNILGELTSSKEIAARLVGDDDWENKLESGDEEE